MHAEPFAILDQLATPLLLISAQGQTQYANPAAASWLGLSARRLSGQSIAMIEAAPAVLPDLCSKALSLGQRIDARHLRFAAPIDEERYADASLTPLDGQPGCALLLELHPVAEFPGADPATEWPAALHAALKGLAHEVKNPLAGLRGAAQLLGRRAGHTDSRELLDVIVAETDRLSALVERLMNPTPPSAPAPTNVHEVLERVRVLAEAEAGWSVVIVRDYDPSLPDLDADADRLTQAIWNLVRNALQSGSSEVRLKTRAEHNILIGEHPVRLALRIEVSDNGRGVPEDLASRIFLPLVSGRAEGTGLGLPLAQEVARAHGGSLSYRSRPGHTVFTLLLPVGAGTARP